MNKPYKRVTPDVPTPEEDRAIREGINSDPDTREILVSDLDRLAPLLRRGRPPSDTPKSPLTTRVDADVLAAMKATGAGWQTRMNQVLRDAVRQGRFRPR